MNSKKLFSSFFIALISHKTNVKANLLAHSACIYPHDIMYVQCTFTLALVATQFVNGKKIQKVDKLKYT